MNASRSILWWMCVWMGMCVGYEIYGLVVCAMNDEKKCPNYPDIMFAMQITSLVMKTIFITCGFMTCKIYRCSEQRHKTGLSMFREHNWSATTDIRPVNGYKQILRIATIN